MIHCNWKTKRNTKMRTSAMNFSSIERNSKEYEPYDSRKREGQTSRCETLVNLIKGILGTGIMALPDGYKNAGLVIGTVGMIVITMIVTFGLHLLFHAMYILCKRDQVPQITYPKAFKEGLKVGPPCIRHCANAAPYFVNFFIILHQLGTMCIFIVFCATNIKQVIDIQSSPTSIYTAQIYMIIMLPFFLLICYVKNLKYLAPFSSVANWLTFTGLICIYYFLYESIEPISERKLFASVNTIPLFIGVAMFSVLPIGAILSIEFNMKEGKYWGGKFGVLNQGMLIVTMLNIFTGFSGYWKYGESTEDVITLNIDIHHPLAKTLRVLFSIAIYITFALQAYPATEIIWEQYTIQYMETSQHTLLWEYILRTNLVLISFILAVVVSRIDLFISLFGAFCLSVLGIIFPALLDICIRWPDDFGNTQILLLRDIALIIFGFAAFGFGTYTACSGIILKFFDKELS